MHTTNGKKIRFFHNGDYSGDVKMIEIKTGKEIGEVPFDDLKTLVAQYVRDERVQKLEDASDDHVLGL